MWWLWKIVAHSLWTTNACVQILWPRRSRTCWSMWHIAEVVPLNHVIGFIVLVKHAAFLLHWEGILNNFFSFREKLHAGSMLMWWMHHLEKCTGVFIKNAHLNMVQMRLPPPPFSMLTQTCDFVECKLFHKRRPLLQLVLVCCTWQHWTRGIGGESLHACLVCWMGVYYENTGLENPMFRNRYAHLLVIEIVVFAPVVSAPRLSTLTLLHLKPPATQPCMKTKVSRMPVLDHGAASRFESMLHHMHSIRGACRCGLGV